jgi:hypothetical protein
MSYCRSYTVSPVTDGSGNATIYTDAINGRVLSISYVKDGSVPFSNGVAFTITSRVTGINVWTQTAVNASTVCNPRLATNAVDGTAALYAGAGTPVLDHIYLADEQLKIVIGSGGNAKTGTFTVITG